MNRRLITLSAVCAAVIVTGCAKKEAMTGVDESEAQKTPAVSTPAKPSKAPEASESSMGAMNSGYKFKLAAIKNSGREGTAWVSETGGKVKVTIEMLENKAMDKKATGSATASSSAMPAHIHLGSCPAPDKAPKYPLTDVVNGKSETTLPAGVTVASLKALGKLAINVHKSAADLGTYVACGDMDWSTGTTQKLENEADKMASSSGKAKSTGKPEKSEKPETTKSPSPRPSGSASPAATQ